MQRRVRLAFSCRECGVEFAKWHGRCPECQAWNSMDERVASERVPTTNAPSPVRITDVVAGEEMRTSTAIGEFDRVLGGGIVPGSLTLIGGDPGIGKSTLILQIASTLARSRPVLYVSGEESAPQLRMRADRLGAAASDLFLLTETDLDSALRAASNQDFGLVVIDSIQTMHAADVDAIPGGVVQLRECAVRLMQWSKSQNVPVMMIGHVTKEGDLAGPRVLEHIVDVVLYLEGERFSQYRLLRGVKNRFGSVSEVGVFEMRDSGMTPVDNPSEVLLSERTSGMTGAVVVPAIEGTRSLLVEMQALVSPAAYGTPQRRASGVDTNRMLLVTAVLGRRAGVSLGAHDVLVSVAGGIRVQEPASDLGLALAIASCALDENVPGDLVAFGEIGLSGELRSVGQIERRLAEAERLGFRRCVLPTRSVKAMHGQTSLELLPCDSLQQALRRVLNYRGSWEDESRTTASNGYSRSQRPGRWKRDNLARETVFE